MAAQSNDTSNSVFDPVCQIPVPTVSEHNLDSISDLNYITNSVVDVNDSLTVLHTNIRSLRNKFEDLKVMLAQTGLLPSIVVVSETWLKDYESSMFNLPGYLAYFACRNTGVGGGVAIYIRNNLQHNVIRMCNNGYYSLWIELSDIGNLKKVFVGGYYRPPNFNLQDFLAILDNDLGSSNNCPTIVSGDFNINTNTQSSASTLYNTVCSCNSFKILNTVSTRVTDTAASTIDHFISNILNRGMQVFTVDNHVSDHRVLFLSVKCEGLSNATAHPTVIRKTDYNLLDRLMGNELGEFSFPNRNDVNENAELLVNTISELVSKVTLAVAYKYRNRYSLTSWATSEFLNLVTERDKLYKKYKKKRGNTYIKEQLNLLNNRITGIKRKLITEYNVKKVSQCQGNVKLIWREINRMLGNKNKTSTDINSINNSAGVNIIDKQDITNTFCDHFSSIGHNLSASIVACPNSNINSFHTLTHLPDSIFMLPSNNKEITDIIYKLESKSPGLDNIAALIVKRYQQILTPLLTELVNQVLHSGVYPNILKYAKVIPLHKKGDRKLLNNYRPISVLSVINKIFELVIKKRLLNFFEGKDILYNHQYGFRRNRNTSLAALTLVDKIKLAIDNNKVAGAIFIDLCKAFDLVNHKILLDKLEYYGVRGLALKLITSYLSDRYQTVYVGTHKSDSKIVDLGVPQGSVLGPILFLIYINDIGNLKLHGMPFLFADDTVLFYGQTSDAEQMLQFMQEDLNTLAKFFSINKLVLNLDKTNYIVFSSPLYMLDHHMALIIDNKEIARVPWVKYLGLYIDEHLKWKVHIDMVIKKVLPAISALHRLYALQVNIKRAVYFSLIHSHLQYLSIIWGSAAKTILRPLQIIQTKALKIVYNYPRLTPTISVFSNANILPIRFLYEYNLLNHVFNSASRIKSPIYSTRYANDGQLCTTRTDYGRMASTFHGHLLFNKLPKDIKNLCSFYQFKQQLKKLLLQRVSLLDDVLTF